MLPSALPVAGLIPVSSDGAPTAAPATPPGLRHVRDTRLPTSYARRVDSALRHDVLTAARGRCQARAVDACWRTASSVHHLVGKGRGGRLLDAVGATAHLLAVCEPCHRHIHDSGDGYAAGWLIHGQVVSTLDGRPVYVGPDDRLTALYGPDTRAREDTA